MYEKIKEKYFSPLHLDIPCRFNREYGTDYSKSIQNFCHNCIYKSFFSTNTWKIELFLSHCNIPFMNELCRTYLIFCILSMEIPIYSTNTTLPIRYFYKYIDWKNDFWSTTMSNTISSKTSVEQDDVVLIYACAKKTFGFNA